jgi:hypothetical protein
LAAVLGGGLTLLGVVGLAGADLGLTTTHDLAHLFPGLALLAAALPQARGRARLGLLLGVASFFVALGAASLVAPEAVEPTLGISAWANVVHLAGGLALLGAGFLLDAGDR